LQLENDILALGHHRANPLKYTCASQPILASLIRAREKKFVGGVGDLCVVVLVFFAFSPCLDGRFGWVDRELGKSPHVHAWNDDDGRRPTVPCSDDE
jgi:hypothetical protein